MSAKRCFYEVLGCNKGAPADEIRKAYRREALKYHPDRNPGDQAAEVRFKEVNEAYQVLSDDERRSIYDRFGHAGLEGGAGGFDGGLGDMFSQMQDLFSEMFSGGGNPFGSRRGSSGARRGGDLRVQARLSFREAALGCKKDISVATPVACDECSGSGAKKGTRPETCPTCRGAGQVSTARGFVMFTSTCQRCGGQGSILKEPCTKCDGRGLAAEKRTVVVSFPAGIDNGQRLRVSGKGMPGVNGPAGDLYVDVAVDEDPRFERDGADLVTRAHVSLRQAALGETIDVPCIAPDESATVKVSVPAGTQPGTVFTLKGQGLPRLDGRGRGALVVVVQVDVPTRVSSRARELLEELDRELGTKDAGVAAP